MAEAPPSKAIGLWVRHSVTGLMHLIKGKDNAVNVNLIAITGAANPVRSDMEGGGIIAVGTTRVEVTFTGITNKVIIQAIGANTGNLYVGDSTVTSAGANAIAELEPGDVLTMDYDNVTTAIYVVSDTAAQSFIKGALL